MMRWFRQNVVFLSWGPYWKGVYIHCLSRKWTYRVYWSMGRPGVDWHAKDPLVFSELAL